MSFTSIILLLTALATALITGLLYSYSVSVNPGLAKMNDAGYLTAMQHINKAILNPLFFLSFFGTLLLLPLSCYLNYQPSSVKFYLLLGAAVVYTVGMIGVTIFGNIPLNNMLEKYDVANASPAQLTAMRSAFETKWNMFHTIRTVASFISLVLVLIACIRQNN